MRKRRADDARKRSGVLAACLQAWRDGEDGIDADVAALVVAEALLAMRAQGCKG
jgi:hypothetical protein